MFERHTESARRALFFARLEVSRWGASAVASEHLLFGLLQERHGIVAEILQQFQLDPAQVRRDLEQRLTRSPAVPTSVEVPFADDAMRALQQAGDEADRLLHDYIGTEHLLLGLLGDPKSTAGSVLAARGLQLADARKIVVQLLERSPALRNDEGIAYSPERSDALARIAKLRQLVRQLADAAPQAGESRDLAANIDRDLEELRRYIDRPGHQSSPL